MSDVKYLHAVNVCNCVIYSCLETQELHFLLGNPDTFLLPLIRYRKKGKYFLHVLFEIGQVKSQLVFSGSKLTFLYFYINVCIKKTNSGI